MRHLDETYGYPAADEAGWDMDAGELAEALRSALDEGYADASDEEMDDALANVLDSLSAAEAFNFTSALNRIGKSAGQLVSDPTFAAVAQTALPILGGAAGTMIGGPVGTALGSKLGSLAASALPTRPAPAPLPPPPTAPPPPAASPVTPPAPAVAPPVPAAQPAAAVPAAAIPPLVPPAAPSAPAPPAAAGSAAAAQGLVLTQQPEVLRSLLATALGQHGRQTVSGIPVAQVLGMLSQVFGQAAADADELMYHDQQPDSTESVLPDSWAGSADALYADLLGADNQELAEATSWDWTN
jgi:hypothetical protein